MGNIPKGWRTKEWKEFKQQNPNDYLDKLHGRELQGYALKDPFGFNKAINYEALDNPETLKMLDEIFNKPEPEQLEFDFGLMETIDRSLNMPKKA